MYAKDPSILYKEKANKIVEMGFTEDQAIAALKKTGGNEEEAVSKLLGA